MWVVDAAPRLAQKPGDLALLILYVGKQRFEIFVAERLVVILLDERAQPIEQVALREAQPPVLADLHDDVGQVPQHQVLERHLPHLLVPHALQPSSFSIPVADLRPSLLCPVGGDELDRFLDRLVAGRVPREAALAAIDELGTRTDQVREENDRLAGTAPTTSQLVTQVERIGPERR
jgi:hypothetical protein